MYGGDYITLRREIDNFLVMLMKCKIKPFLVFDGTIDHKKINTVVARTHEKLETAVTFAENTHSNYDSSDHYGHGLTPSNSDCILDLFLGSEVIIETVKRVLDGGCVFVAGGDVDIDIASLTIHHRCPVLSNDSDFYIFPLQSILQISLE